MGGCQYQIQIQSKRMCVSNVPCGPLAPPAQLVGDPHWQGFQGGPFQDFVGVAGQTYLIYKDGG